MPDGQLKAPVRLRPATEISRVTRSKAQAKASYDRLSRWYDAIAGRAERPLLELGVRDLAVREGETVLEIGFGTGHGLEALARAVGTTGRVYGIDISEGMRDVARERLQSAGLLDRVTLSCGDAAALPFPSSRFDAVFLSFTLELFDTPEIPVVLRECQRVLRRQGRIGVVALSKERETWATRAYEWLHRTVPRYADCRPIFPRRALTETGFRVVRATRRVWWGLLIEIVLARRD